MNEPSIVGLVQVRTKAEAVYQELSARILEGVMAPGSTVNQEVLASMLGVSVTPLREALRRLESDGMVILEAHRTLTIAPLSAQEFQDLYAVRLELDPFAAALAAEKASPAALDHIEALAVREREQTLLARLKANRTFHQTIYRASGNNTLAAHLDQLWDQTDRYRLIALQASNNERVVEREHCEIAAAIKARKAELARKLMRAHVEKILRLVEQNADFQ